MSRDPTARRKLDEMGIEKVCDLIMDGETLRDISILAQVDKHSLIRWLSEVPERSALATEARRLTSQSHEEEALRVVVDVEEDLTAIAKAREISSVHRWLARIRDPDKAGDKVENKLVGDLNLHRIISDKPQTEEEWSAAHGPDAG
jgi:hypothetical protein